MLATEKRTYPDEALLREKVPALCRNFYQLGWVSGTGGGISVRRDDIVYMAPSGVQKEKITGEDLFILSRQGEILVRPANEALKLTECAPLFSAAYELRDAGAVIHSHSSNVVLATFLAEAVDEGLSELRFTRLEMMKGIQGHGYFDTYVLPVIDNTARECDLTDSLRRAIERYPQSPAVAVRDHGIYVWGRNEDHAKTQAECIDYLCEIAWKRKSIGA
ncbi:methylthioribulose 1-phosphate dehydratase [Leptonema illini]|uniref:Methylthioribulose 1-phosphate dehydratase n=1 Tax=Leptonema illini DSM 21528 TaxID=929563 RepID=H2CCD6_9LEPT|nr:methylthioribulose 1-phosphate dehydratase [Leptonema illini]EHQ06393.1 methylthioribulose-1-phosphate dehydratase [Leptonema illini DSM 21528]